MVTDSFERTDERHTYEPAFRRWLVREITEQGLTLSEACSRFNFHPVNGKEMVRQWLRRYGQEMVLPLPPMTEKEKQDMLALQKKLRAMEQQLEDARMRNIALSTLIDVAEEKLKINIRKKPGAKQ